jgi:hypothetical protein
MLALTAVAATDPDVVTSGEECLRQTTQRAEKMVSLGRPVRLHEVGLLALCVWRQARQPE